MMLNYAKTKRKYEQKMCGILKGFILSFYPLYLLENNKQTCLQQKKKNWIKLRHPSQRFLGKGEQNI